MTVIPLGDLSSNSNRSGLRYDDEDEDDDDDDDSILFEISVVLFPGLNEAKSK